MTQYFLIIFRKRNYFLLLVFAIWMLFIDKNSYFERQKLNKSYTKLEEELVDYNKKYKLIEAEYDDVRKNKEKYGREKYKLHKKNEKVYIFE